VLATFLHLFDADQKSHLSLFFIRLCLADADLLPYIYSQYFIEEMADPLTTRDCPKQSVTQRSNREYIWSAYMPNGMDSSGGGVSAWFMSCRMDLRIGKWRRFVHPWILSFARKEINSLSKGKTLKDIRVH